MIRQAVKADVPRLSRGKNAAVFVLESVPAIKALWNFTAKRGLLLEQCEWN